MPSTRPPLSLTIGFRRAETVAFWLMATFGASLILGLASAWIGARQPWIWAMGGAAVLLPGAVRPAWYELGIRAWNKGVTVMSRALRSYVLAVSYYLLFAAVGRAGSRLDVDSLSAGRSSWVPKRAPDSDGRRAGQAPASDPSMQGLLAQMRAPGNRWMVCLLPVMFLLAVLRDERRESAPPSATYTLY